MKEVTASTDEFKVLGGRIEIGRRWSRIGGFYYRKEDRQFPHGILGFYLTLKPREPWELRGPRQIVVSLREGDTLYAGMGMRLPTQAGNLLIGFVEYDLNEKRQKPLGNTFVLQLKPTSTR